MAQRYALCVRAGARSLGCEEPAGVSSTSAGVAPDPRGVRAHWVRSGRPGGGTACDLPAGHDEDGDGVDDACDVCPHISDNQADADLDGVGDACDPLPLPTEHIAMFDPFTGMVPAWNYDGGETFTGDTLSMPGASAGNVNEILIGAPTIDLYVLTGTIGGVSGATYQFAMSFNNPVNRRVYCEAYEDPSVSTMYVDIVDFDGTTYRVIDTSPVSPVATLRGCRCRSRFATRRRTSPAISHSREPRIAWEVRYRVAMRRRSSGSWRTGWISA